MTIMATPLRLSSRTPEGVRLLNALLLRHISSAWPLGDRTVRLSFSPLPVTMCAQALCTVYVNELPWRVAISDDSVLRLHEFFQEPDLKGVQPGELPADLQRAIALSLFAPWGQALAERTGTSVRLIDWQTVNESVSGDFGVTLSWKEGTTTLVFLPGEGAVDAFLPGLQSLPRREVALSDDALTALPFELSFVMGTLALDRSVLTSLEPGDVLFPDDLTPNPGKLSVRLLSHGIAQKETQAVSEGDGYRITEWQPMPETFMQETDDLTLELTFELENRRITFGDLKKLVPGYVFKLTSAPDAPVTVRANGKAVARGRLVDVNGTIGVQLIECPIGGDARGSEDGH